jgi:ubiquinone/menaquinone biosynthesis C-methylase UbiE
MTDSLLRVLEPEVMDSDAEAQDYDAMDHSIVNEKFADDLFAAWNDRAPVLENGRKADVLDLGTGTAQIPIVLARKWDGCRIMAADAAVSMLEIARYNLEIAGLIERIQLAHVDAKTLAFSAQHFDVVMSNSIVHHIPEPKTVLAEALRVLRPGGLLFFRDLFRPATLTQLEQLVQTYTGNENEHSQRMFAESLHAALSLEEIRGLVTELGGDPNTVNATSDRHWTWIHWK